MSLHEKEPAPLLPDESLRSTKKVRIRSTGVEEDPGSMMDIPDSEMVDNNVVEALSYRDKLLNKTQAGTGVPSEKEVELCDTDFHISREGEIPSIAFLEAIRATISKGMERTLIIKLLGRSITYYDLRARTQALWRLKGSCQLVDTEGSFYFVTFDLEEDYDKVLTGGPWMIFGVYLTVQPWSLDFDARSSVIGKVVAWVRIPGLSFRYYHKSTLRAIGSLLGEVVKMDYMTETKGRGKYARLAVMMDLQKPLVPWILVDGKRHGVEYEGLPLICFECGLYGHPKERCKSHGKMMSSASNHEKTPDIANNHEKPGSDQALSKESINCRKEAEVVGSPESLPSPYGTWMQEGIVSVKSGPNNVVGSHAKLVDREQPKGIGRTRGTNSQRFKQAPGQQAQVYRKKEVLVGHSCGSVQNNPSTTGQKDGLIDHAMMGSSSEKVSTSPIDCLVATVLIKEPNGRVNANMGLVRRAHMLMAQDWRVSVTHVYREGNCSADFLATYALMMSVGWHMIVNLPAGLITLLQ
ncbi:hypothetical protein K1719_040622 [Acacia pycnantha]|nr:hypothetical protein K1719_040622 [Acacia pycnantha]